MADKLTAKQEGFVQDVFIGMSLAQSYRNHYDTSNMTEKSVWELASREMAKVKVTSRLANLQQEASERSQITVESITRELEEARQKAINTEQSSAMTAASMGKAKVNGLLVEKSVIDLQGKLDTKWTVEIIPSDKGK